MCQVSFILDPDDMRKLHILMRMMGKWKITHSNCSDSKHRWGSEAWILARMDSFIERREVGVVKILRNDEKSKYSIIIKWFLS